MTKVSIIVPVYNKEKYLEKCIDSLLSQSLEDLEIIVVNDGSTDNSKNILEKYAQKFENIKLINQENQGLGAARNSGLELANGEYIGFVDGDDFVHENMYEIMYEQARKNNADLLICDYDFFPHAISGKTKWFNQYKGVIDANFLDRNTQPWNKIVSNKLLKDIKFSFFEKNGDGAYINIFLHAKKIVTINNKLYYYRVGQSSMSTNYNIDHYEREVLVARNQMEMLNNSIYFEQLREYFEYRIIYTLIQAMTVSILNDKKNLYKEYRGQLTNLNFKNNTYTNTFLKKHMGILKFIAIKNLLPNCYYISRIFLKILM